MWADKLRDISAVGLQHAPTIYDREPNAGVQTIAMEMVALATAQSLAAVKPLRTTHISRPGPVVAGTAAVVDEAGTILLMRRSDNGLWNMPGGGMEVGETPVAGVMREAYEETGVRCEDKASSRLLGSHG